MATLTDKQAELLLKPNYAVAATVRGDGSPQQTVVWVDWDGENVVFNTAEGRAKPRHIRRNPQVSVNVMDPADPYTWLSVSWTPEVSTEGAEDHIDKLAKKYLGKDTYPFRKPGEQRLIVRVRPERVDAHGLD